MKPQATRLQDFPQLITCALCLKIQIVQVLWTMKRWKAKYAGDVRERSTDDASARRIDQGIRRAVDAPLADFIGGTEALKEHGSTAPEAHSSKS
jgi:hypothetical protein